MRVVVFCHSLRSDWNHGNAHFLRGITWELLARGHDVRVFEPVDAWSACYLEAQEGPGALSAFQQHYPGLSSCRYRLEDLDLDLVLDRADLVLVHEWNAPACVARLGEHRRRRGRYVLFFHDTHHRSVTDPGAMRRYDLSGYDGVLAFGERIRMRYLDEGWASRVWTWHEAADVRLFRPRQAASDCDVAWIGNWGDEERTAELHEFLLDPVRRLGLRGRVFGVRYPPEALTALADAGCEYRGWLPNYLVPDAFARARFTVHVPRRAYVTQLPGIPTIRPFEALACGIPLISAPWEDAEGLFAPGRDYLVARSGAEMTAAMQAVLHDDGLRAALAAHGRETILARHTCAHRVDQLLAIAEEVVRPPARGATVPELRA
jgi:spore maturation protein CgeB